MGVTVTDNTVTFRGEKIRNASLFLRFMLDEIDKNAFPKTPKREGNLRKDLQKQVLGLHATIRWQKDYALIQETKQFKHYTTPGTGPHFAEQAVYKSIENALAVMKKASLV